LDLDLDVVLIQEPYAVTVSPSEFSLKYVPDGYSVFHNLSSDHAYGTAIIAKTSLKATASNLGRSNNCCGIHISPSLLFFSIYCRPSLASVPVFLSSFLNKIPPNVKRFSVICCDANVKNKLWNSPRTTDAGLELEHIFRSNGFSIANVNVDSLPHKPTNTQFVDVTVTGDRISLSDWQFPSMPSLSDHPFISFSVERGKARKSHLNCRNPPPSHFMLDVFHENVALELNQLPSPSAILSTFTTEQQVDDFMTTLHLSLSKSIAASLLPFHPSNIPGKMPWWSKTLWALRHNLRNAYKLKSVPNPPAETVQSYRLLKSTFQRALRKKKKRKLGICLQQC
jgi:hypothetical protein